MSTWRNAWRFLVISPFITWLSITPSLLRNWACQEYKGSGCMVVGSKQPSEKSLVTETQLGPNCKDIPATLSLGILDSEPGSWDLVCHVRLGSEMVQKSLPREVAGTGPAKIKGSYWKKVWVTLHLVCPSSLLLQCPLYLALSLKSGKGSGSTVKSDLILFFYFSRVENRVPERSNEAQCLVNISKTDSGDKSAAHF